MKDYDKHIDFYNQIETDFEQKDDELWTKIESQIATKKETKVIKLNWLKYAVAASILLILGTSVFLRFYTKTIFSKKGEHLFHTLPDNSIVELNAETSLSYQPYWWSFNREIEFSGEAFFKVEKGEKFTVISEEGRTQVLGTSFNIYARNTDYKVFCKTGKVKVNSQKSDIKFIIQENEIAIINNKKKEGSKSKSNSKLISWKENKFNFTDEPLKNVFAEIERQFNVEIQINDKNINNNKFTAYFEKPKNIEQTLNLICLNFNLKFTKINKAKYRISTNKN